jgi:hypothetical protein
MDEIKVTERQDLEEAIKWKIDKICGGYHILDGTHPVDLNTRVDLTLIVSTDGKIYSTNQKVWNLLVPKEVEPTKETEEPKGRYNIKK